MSQFKNLERLLVSSKFGISKNSDELLKKKKRYKEEEYFRRLEAPKNEENLENTNLEEIELILKELLTPPNKILKNQY